MTVRRLIALALSCLAARNTLSAQAASAQATSAERMRALANGLTVTARVLVIGAEPGDADADLIAWLARGHQVQTAYLSLTRGENRPNFAGAEAGAAVGAVRVQEALAARAIDGGEQYFTHAFDVGSARNATEAFRQWDHAKLLGDVVTVVRAFRPHVIVARFADDTSAHDGKRQVSAILAREAFAAATDTMQYSVSGYGLPWTTSSVFGPGTGITIDAREWDRMIGATYADVATMSRAQYRSPGFATLPWDGTGVVQLRQVAARDADHPAMTGLFDGIDTTFARLGTGAPADLARLLPAIAAYADSTRRQLDVEWPALVVGYLSRLSEVVSSARNLLHGCRHPSPRAALTIVTYRPCTAVLLDLDASLDLMVARTSDALMAAAGITVTAVADREFVATGDATPVKVTVSNHGESSVRVNDVAITGGIAERMLLAVNVPVHGSLALVRSVTHLSDAHPWWMWKREENFFPYSTVGLDGVTRADVVPKSFAIDDIAVPEGMRTVTDAVVTLTVGTTTITSSTRPVAFRSADPILGVRDRPVSGVLPVTLGFERTMEWAVAGKPLKKQVRMIARSYSERARTFALRTGPASGGVRLDSLPRAITLNPNDARELFVTLRGTPTQMRYELPLVGVAGSEQFTSGFRTAQYTYLPPLHFFRKSTLSVQGVAVDIPPRLAVAYVRGAGDDLDIALKQLGVPTYSFNAEGLLRFGLDGISTLVFGPEAFRVDPNLAGMSDRFEVFMRKGGTIVMLGNPAALPLPGIVPYPLAIAAPYPDQVTTPTAPVTAIGGSRLLAWPNRITAADWKEWVGDRATSIPSVVDPRYEHMVMMHDPGEPDNRSALLAAPVGKGHFIYSSITFPQQIANGVPGAMRLFINLLSAGITPSR
jgi:LmbE family N-acetylglucosaminyl deacetylase